MKKTGYIFLAVFLSVIEFYPAQPLSAAEMHMEMHNSTTVDSLAPAVHPRYPVGTAIIVKADHMSGMKNAKGTVSGVFDTPLYAVDYVNSHGEAVSNHKWVIQQEIQDSGSRSYQLGDQVTLLPGHMSGLGGSGVHARLVQTVKGPAYMIDYQPTDGTSPVIHHQWVTQNELQPR